MNKMFPLLVLTFIVLGCNRYENKSTYNLNIGETVDIYFTTNSCCHYCISNESELKHIKLIETKSVKSGRKDCEGCDYTSAYVFKSVSAGIDTLKLKLIAGSRECDNNDSEPEKYIIAIN